MSEELYKSLFLRDKEFLKALYDASASHVKTILNFASDSKLNTLIKFLHLVSNGVIKVRREHFEHLENKHLKLIKKHLESKASVKKLIQADRKTKLTLLLKFTNKYHALLFTWFNEIM